MTIPIALEQVKQPTISKMILFTVYFLRVFMNLETRKEKRPPATNVTPTKKPI